MANNQFEVRGINLDTLQVVDRVFPPEQCEKLEFSIFAPQINPPGMVCAEEVVTRRISGNRVSRPVEEFPVNYGRKTPGEAGVLGALLRGVEDL